MISKTLITLYSLMIPVSTTIDHTTGKSLPEQPKISLGIYQHYKGNYYLVLCVSRHTETGEEMVVYQSLYGDLRVWARPIDLFVGDIEYKGVLQSRFRKVADANKAEEFVNL